MKDFAWSGTCCWPIRLQACISSSSWNPPFGPGTRYFGAPSSPDNPPPGWGIPAHTFLSGTAGTSVGMGLGDGVTVGVGAVCPHAAVGRRASAVPIRTPARRFAEGLIVPFHLLADPC